MAVLLYELSETGDFEVLSALGFILLAMTPVLVGVGMKLVGRDFMLRRTQEFCSRNSDYFRIQETPRWEADFNFGTRDIDKRMSLSETLAQRGNLSAQSPT